MATITLGPTGAIPARLPPTIPQDHLAVLALLPEPRNHITRRRRTSTSRNTMLNHTSPLPPAAVLPMDTILRPTINHLTGSPTGSTRTALSSHHLVGMAAHTRSTRATELRPPEDTPRSMRLLLALPPVPTELPAVMGFRPEAILGVTRGRASHRTVASRPTASNNRMDTAHPTEAPFLVEKRCFGHESALGRAGTMIFLTKPRQACFSQGCSIWKLVRLDAHLV